MSIAATIIADSVSPEGIRLCSIQVTAHRYILAEINTHRDFTRNYRSSRAVPVSKLLEEVRTNPAMPVRWEKNQPGMQSSIPMDPGEEFLLRSMWKDGAIEAANRAEFLAKNGLHKQWANRVIEPYLYVHGLISSTSWANFFTLRRHKDAQPEFKDLADAMYEAMETSTPVLRHPGGWHLPYIDEDTWMRFSTEDCKKISVARCARVSYKPFDADRPSKLEEDLELYNKLVGAQPLHASPAEHQATPDTFYPHTNDQDPGGTWENPSLHGNFQGWIQYRKQLAGERVYDERYK